MQPFIWICLVDGPTADPSLETSRIRAWTADPMRAEQLRKNGLDMRPLFAAPVELEAAVTVGAAQDAPQAKQCLNLAATFENAKRVNDYNPAIRELQSDFTFFDDECKLIAKALRRMAASELPEGMCCSVTLTDPAPDQQVHLDAMQKVALTPEQVFLVNDMIHAWIEPEKKAEFREAFRNDCKRLLATALSSTK